MDQALTALGSTPQPYTNPTLTPQVTTVKKVDIDDLRNRVRGASHVSRHTPIPQDGTNAGAYDAIFKPHHFRWICL